MTLYTGTPEFVDYLTKFKSFKQNFRFEIYCEVADPESPAGTANGRGARAVVLRDVLLHGSQLFKLDTEDGLLDYSVDFDFDDYDILQNFEPTQYSALADTGAAGVGDFVSNLVNAEV